MVIIPRENNRKREMEANTIWRTSGISDEDSEKFFNASCAFSDIFS